MASKSEKLTIEQRRRIYCVKNGHSRLRDYCFGYHHCVRCGQMLGDSLGGAYSDNSAVYISHMRQFARDGARAKGCNCPENAKRLTKKDFTMVPQWIDGYESRPPWREQSSTEKDATRHA